MAFLEIQNLWVKLPLPHGEIEAVRGVSLSVEKGEIFGLVGESGSGKTMTCLTLSGLAPTSARVVADKLFLDGVDLQNVDWRSIRGSRVAMIFQDPASALNPVFKIGSQIDLVLKRHTKLEAQARRQRVIELLRDVGLPDPAAVAQRYPHQLSGGMQQRALIALALSAGADLLIADEPTTALDVTIQAQILKLLRKLRDQYGLTILFITHDLGVVANICDRAAVLRLGRLMETGPVNELLKQPKHPYTKALLEALPNKANRGQRLKTVPAELAVSEEI